MIHAKPLKRKALQVKATPETSHESLPSPDVDYSEITSRQSETKISGEDALLLSPYVKYTKDNYKKEYEAEQRLETKARGPYEYEKKKVFIIEEVVKLRNGNVTLYEIYALIRGYCKHYNIDWSISLGAVQYILMKLILEDRLTRIKVQGMWHYYPKL